MSFLLRLLPWLGLAALIWYTVRCVAADRKPLVWRPTKSPKQPRRRR